MKSLTRNNILFVVFPKLVSVTFSVRAVRKVFGGHGGKMRFPVKLAIGCAVAFVLMILVGFVAFPKMIKGKVKKMVVLDPESEIRKMFVKVPFALDFKVYLFNVTNPMEIQGGAKPMVHQVGPFCYQEFKEKVDISDDEENDFMFYRAKDTFIKKKIAPDCLTGDEVISIPHPMIVGMINTLVRQKPAMLTLATKAINSIFRNPASIFLTAKVNDILFDGVIIDCSVKDFAGKAVCTQLKDAPDLRKVSDTELAFSFFTPKNGTAGKVFKVLRGKKVSHDVGRVIEYDGKPAMEVWPTKECNAYQGSDGTVFPPYLTKEEGLPSFAPDLCRSLVAKYEKNTKYDGIPVRLYTATLGDMSRNKDEKCYCLTEDTCLKKGMFDLYKCVGVPLYVSLPHFYESDKSYVNAVGGLNPNRKEHGIELFFESITGGPVSARKRLQFNMPIEPNDKVPLFNKLQPCVLPMFWVEEGVALNNTFTGPIKTLFKMMKIVKIATWVIVLASLGGMGAAAYLMYGKKGAVNVTPVKKVKPAEEPPNGVTTVNGDGFGGHVNHAMSDNEIDKY